MGELRDSNLRNLRNLRMGAMKQRALEGFPENPKLVFMGTPAYAAPSLEKLVEKGYAVQAVVTQPDRPRGRGRKRVPSAIKTAAQRFGLPVFQPETASDPAFCERIQDLGPDLLVVVAFGQVLKTELLSIPGWGGLNIHASLLPRYRGAAPIQWAIMNDEPETGLSAMRMEEGLDTGPVLLQKAVPIGPEETAGELHDRLARLSGEVLIKTIEGMSCYRVSETPQESRLATYAPKIEKDLVQVNWDRSARLVSALIRGLDPWPGAVTMVGEKTLKLFSAAVETASIPGDSGNSVPGRTVDASAEGLLVETGNGVVRIRELQAPGKKRLPVSDFLRGFSINKGTVLGR